MQIKKPKWAEMVRLILCQSIISRLPLTGSFNKLEQNKISSVEETRTQNKPNESLLEKLKST